MLFTVLLGTGILLSVLHAAAQSTKQPAYRLQVQFIDKDNSFDPQPLKLQTAFATKQLCLNYIQALPKLLSSKGYPTASVDSIFEQQDLTTIHVFLGKQYQWIKLRTDSVDKAALDDSRFREKDYNGRLLNIPQLISVQERILNYYENNGYPFAQVFLDSIRLDEEKMDAMLKARKGILYHVDSIRLFGKAKISRRFLQHYLGISNGSLYNKEKLQQVGKRLLELPYLQEVQPNDLSLLGTGSVLNLYLAPRRSSQVN
ncbi:MAG TPA: POTRA domain-containing protein, partial [Ferruginibacter sp.]|nr:POTRA domain-containing protein [Ferruginibacter sp.]